MINNDIRRIIENAGSPHRPQNQNLYHLTRLIDRTTDIYSFKPVLPLTTRTINRFDPVRVTLATLNRRVREKKDIEGWWNRLREGAEKVADKDISDHFLNNSFELDWAQRIEKPYQLLEASIGINIHTWKRTMVDLIGDRINSAARKKRNILM